MKTKINPTEWACEFHDVPAGEPCTDLGGGRCRTWWTDYCDGDTQQAETMYADATLGDMDHGVEDPAAVPLCDEHGERPSSICTACQVARFTAQDNARENIRRSTAAVIAFPESVRLDALLDEEDDDQPYLIDTLMRERSRVLMVAQAKVGKTTLRNGFVRSMVDGDPFIDHFEVGRTLDNVVVLDMELSRPMLRDWFRKERIQNTGSVEVMPMRGLGGSFDMLNPEVRSRWAERLRGADAVVFDCLEPVLNALGLSVWNEGRKFLDAFDVMMAEAEVPNLLTLHHMGHGAQRAKGDSGIIGWADELWNINCDDPMDPEAPRELTCFGRGSGEGFVGLLELRDGRTVLGEGTKFEVNADKASDALLKALVKSHDQRRAKGETIVMWDNDQLTAIGLKVGLHRDPTRLARRALVEAGDLLETKGVGRSGKSLYQLKED